MSSKSSSRHSPTRRPKLMRASATAPSLATSNASRQDLASLQDSRATTLLTRMANYSSAQMQGYEHGSGHRSRIGSLSSSGGQSPNGNERREPFEIAVSQCKSPHLIMLWHDCFLLKRCSNGKSGGNYFSFPSFEDFEDYHERDGREESGVR